MINTYIILIFLALVLLYFFYKLKYNKIKRIVAFSNSFLWLLVLYTQINSYSPNEVFKEQCRLYFHNDASMYFYFIIAPGIIIGTILPILSIVLEIVIKFIKKIYAQR